MKKFKIIAIAAAAVLAGTFFFTNEELVKADASEEAVIEEGVYIGGIDVGGMTADEATKAVNTYVDGLQEQWITLVGPKDTLRYTLSDLGLSAKTSTAVQEAAAVGKSGNLVKRFKELQALDTQDYVVDMGLSIDKQLTAQNIYNKTSKINVKAINNGLTRENGKFVYVEGQEGNEVDIVTAVNELNEYIGSEWEIAAVENAEFTLASIISQPRGTQEELSVVKDLIGTFTTNYSSSSSGRAKNVENGAAKLNGAVLYPGDELSVYEMVNPFTKENGYELAGSYSNGETVESFGGGICQVSTTLYNAVLNAELEITQRYNHSMIVTYVDLSADAAIAGTYKDLRFKNSYDFPVYIEAICSNRNITFNIYGVETRDSNRVVTYESEVLSVNDPDTVYTLSSSAALGTYTTTRSEHVGYSAKLWKVVTVNGVEQERTQVNRSTYQASAKKVTIGTAGATEEQLAAINAALATKDDSYIRSVVTGLKAAGTDKTPATGTGSDTNTGTSTENNSTDTGSTENSGNTESTDTGSTGENSEGGNADENGGSTDEGTGSETDTGTDNGDAPDDSTGEN